MNHRIFATRQPGPKRDTTVRKWESDGSLYALYGLIEIV